VSALLLVPVVAAAGSAHGRRDNGRPWLPERRGAADLPVGHGRRCYDRLQDARLAEDVRGAIVDWVLAKVAVGHGHLGPD